MTTPPSTCPHCGANAIAINYWSCGSDPTFQSDRCKERQAHAATRDRLAKMTEIAEEFIARWRRMAARNGHDEWDNGYYEGHAACANELEAAFSRFESARKEAKA